MSHPSGPQMLHWPSSHPAGTISLGPAVRLVNGTLRSGRLETLVGGAWVGVAVSNTTAKAAVASQACRILGLIPTTVPNVAVVEAPDAFGAPSVQRWATIAYCTGSESALSNCHCIGEWYSDRACFREWASPNSINIANGTTGVPATAQMAITCPPPERA